jgi:hypothetical protein
MTAVISWAGVVGFTGMACSTLSVSASVACDGRVAMLITGVFLEVDHE